MTTSKTWQDILGESAPELLKKANALRGEVLAEGALSVKTKTLMMLLGDALLGHSDGVSRLAKRARDLGAGDAEITETLAVAFLMGGLPGLSTGSSAFLD